MMKRKLKRKLLLVLLPYLIPVLVIFLFVLMLFGVVISDDSSSNVAANVNDPQTQTAQIIWDRVLKEGERKRAQQHF
nr:hypothetical protein [Lactococcus protaetiae]